MIKSENNMIKCLSLLIMSLRNNINILEEVPIDRLPELVKLFEAKAFFAPYITTLVHTCIKWKQSKELTGIINIYSPNNCWENDGTIIVTIQYGVVDLFVFTLQDTCTNLYNGLSQTISALDNIDLKLIFYAIHENHVDTVRRVLKENNRKFNELPGYTYTISPERARKFNTEHSPDVCVKKVERSAANQINAVWPHIFPGSQNYLARYIETNGGYGVFLRSNNEMVAWILRHVCGNMTQVQTQEGFKRKGYASLVTKVLAKEIASEGFWPMSTIMSDNTNSINMFEKIGFHRISQCAFFITY